MVKSYLTVLTVTVVSTAAVVLVSGTIGAKEEAMSAFGTPSPGHSGLGANDDGKASAWATSATSVDDIRAVRSGRSFARLSSPSG